AAKGNEWQIGVSLHQLHGGGGEAERGGIEAVAVVAPFAEPRPGAAHVEGHRAADERGVAERGAGVAAVVEAVDDQDVVALLVSGGVRRAERPVVAVLAALVPIA